MPLKVEGEAVGDCDEYHEYMKEYERYKETKLFID